MLNGFALLAFITPVLQWARCNLLDWWLFLLDFLFILVLGQSYFLSFDLFWRKIWSWKFCSFFNFVNVIFVIVWTFWEWQVLLLLLFLFYLVYLFSWFFITFKLWLVVFAQGLAEGPFAWPTIQWASVWVASVAHLVVNVWWKHSRVRTCKLNLRRIGTAWWQEWVHSWSNGWWVSLLLATWSLSKGLAHELIILSVMVVVVVHLIVKWNVLFSYVNLIILINSYKINSIKSIPNEKNHLLRN